MEKDLTILLLLKDRAPFTWRWMRYANHIKLPFKVLIADGGKDKSVEQLTDKSLFPAVDYDYVRYPYDEDIATYFTKLAKSIQLIKTPLILLASNHDFYFIDSIMEAVSFLKTHPDYSSTRGEVYEISIQPEKNVSEGSANVYGQIKSFQKLYSDPANLAETGLARFEKFSPNPSSLWHDVNRTENIRKAFAYFHESGINDIVLAEYLLNAIIVLKGKTRRGTLLHMLHQEPPDGLGLLISKRDPAEWIMSESWPEYFLSSLKNISTELALCEGMSETKAYNKVLQIYIAQFLGHNIIAKRATKNFNHSPWIVSYGHLLNKNSLLKRLFRKIYLVTKDLKRESGDRKGIKLSPYYQEITTIQNFLRTSALESQSPSQSKV